MQQRVKDQKERGRKERERVSKRWRVKDIQSRREKNKVRGNWKK